MQLILAYPTLPISAQRLASPCFLRVKLSCSVLTILLVSITLLLSIILSFCEVKAVTSPVVFVSVRACSDRGAPSFAQPGHPQWAKGLAVFPCLKKAERAEEFNQQSTVPRVNPWQANWVGQTALLPFTAHRYRHWPCTTYQMHACQDRTQTAYLSTTCPWHCMLYICIKNS